MNLFELYLDSVLSLSKIFSQTESEAIATRLVEYCFGIKKVDIFTEGRSVEVSKHRQNELSGYLKRALQNEPLEYILGHAFFMGLKLKVNPAVLIPRPETEEMVAFCSQQHLNNPVIFDIGTGSGCIALALKSLIPESHVYACDISEDALALARENARIYKQEINCFTADILNDTELESIPSSLDLIVSNPPYVTESEKGLMKENVTDFEPGQALFVPDDDSLVFYRAICSLAVEKLSKGGYLVVEINEKYGKQICTLIQKAGFTEVSLHRDINKKDRFVSARFFI